MCIITGKSPWLRVLLDNDASGLYCFTDILLYGLIGVTDAQIFITYETSE